MNLRISKFIVLGLLGMLVVVLTVNIYLNEIEVAKLNEAAMRGFAIDSPVYYAPGYHILTLFIFLAVVFARSYIVALFLTLVYLIVHVWGTYLRMQGCFLGGDICPPISIFTKLIARYTWADWFASFVIPITLVWLVYSLFINQHQRRSYS